MRNVDISMENTNNNIFINIKKGNKTVRIEIYKPKKIYLGSFKNKKMMDLKEDKNIDTIWKIAENFIGEKAVNND